MALWSGRFEEGVDEFTQEFGASLPIDMAMWAQDIQGSLAHTAMLEAQHIISSEDAEAIRRGLQQISKEIESGEFDFDINDEDIHMAIEKVLIERIGAPGARLHTGRSRNDQVSTDMHLYAKVLSHALMEDNLALRQILLEKAASNIDVVMPGYTHLQHAQPVLFAHHMLAYYWMFERDFDRLKAAYNAANVNPLGAAALAGTTYPLDREMTSEFLGFAKPMHNSLDAVSDRDYVLDLTYAASVAMMHLSRLCEELVLWSSQEFGFITMDDTLSTGSSIMPQKKNPDFAELTRGKMGRVVGSLMGLLVTLKALPLAYNKDLQETKEGFMDAARTLADSMKIVAGMVETMKLHPETMRAAAKTGFTAATDVADYLAKKGMPFRQAHEVVGRLVLICEKQDKGLEDLTLDELRAVSDLFDEDIAGAFDIDTIVNARVSYGGTSTSSVVLQMEEAEQYLEQDRAELDSLQ